MTTDADGSPDHGRPQPGAPYLRVVRGQPTSAELAAVVAVLAARRAATAAAAAAAAISPGDAARPASRSEWANKARLVRHPLTVGPGAWRASASRK